MPRCATITRLSAIAWLVVSPRARADDGEQFFEQRIRPLLSQRCYPCHSVESGKHKGGLLLDSKNGWATGGESGPALVPGDVEASRLIKAVRYTDPDLKMPPTGRLGEAEVQSLEAWVTMGAPDPRDQSTAAEAKLAARVIDWQQARQFWSFAPLRASEPPSVHGAAWCTSPIDRFILASLEAHGLRPAPAADRRTLLRRVTFDLIGLPPTPDEVEAFAADSSADAYARVVDRLLASPHYGERWGRYWLDLARYADSNGLDENLAMSEAFRYRDWVVRALNDDLPYDRFVTMQLAGDLLPEPEDARALFDQWAATGFLVLGPKMLAEQDKQKLVIDVVDEQMDVTARAFLGLTAGCARCHDHKYDPITQRDYYALAGVFKSTSTMQNLDFVSRWRERDLATRADVAAAAAQRRAVDDAQTALNELQERVERDLRRRWIADFSRYLLAATDAAAQAVFVEAEEQSRGNLIVDREQWGTPEVTIARSGSSGLQFVEYDLTFAHASEQRLSMRYASKEARPMRVSLNGELVAAAALGATTGGFFAADQQWFEVVRLTVQPGRNVLRLERDGPVPHLDKLVLVPAGSAWPLIGPAVDGLDLEIVRSFADHLVRTARSADPIFAVWHAFAALGDQRIAEEAPRVIAELRARSLVSPLALSLLDGLAPRSLRELAGRYQTMVSLVERAWQMRLEPPPPAAAAQGEPLRTTAPPRQLDDPEQEKVRQVLYGAGPYQLARAELESFYPPPERAELGARRQALAALRARALPPFERALCVADGTPVDVPVHIRGSHLNLAPAPTPRGFLELFRGIVAEQPIAASESGRLQLARWLTDPLHPLTARVMVNRIWQGHFGSGLVRTPSNFGLRGELPTHPELLDWLAREFVRGGWSMKAMHRAIVCSSAYRMSSAYDLDGARIDPENRLLWRMNRRRLEAEPLRDAILFVSGALDCTIGGSLLATGDGQYVTNDQSQSGARYDVPRRSLYLPVIRNAMYDVFSIFDHGDPSVAVERRPASTVAHQALFFMNSPLVIEQSRALAECLRQWATTSGATREATVDRAHRQAYARPARQDETERALAYLDACRARGLDEIAAWHSYCQVLLAADEFLYLD
ncbi:MAG: PSD1 and planctomycete cytochrome C domain-containing protein [Planctomycetota bacterium]